MSIGNTIRTERAGCLICEPKRIINIMKRGNHLFNPGLIIYVCSACEFDEKELNKETICILCKDPKCELRITKKSVFNGGFWPCSVCGWKFISYLAQLWHNDCGTGTLIDLIENTKSFHFKNIVGVDYNE